MSSFQALRHEFRPTLRLALPLVLAEVGWMTMGVVDTIMVGRLPNSAIAIGATGLGQSLYNIVGIFGAGLLLGLDTFVAQAHGREDMQDARHSLANGFFLALALTPILMFLISLWPALMHRFGVSTELIDPMRPFLRALNWGTLPLLCYFGLRRYLQAVNVVHPIMFALVSANLVNFVGNWALIYGHLGFHAMGITGSGWSTCFARIYMALVMFGTLLYVESKRGLSAWIAEIQIDLRRIWHLLALGAPAATQILLEIGAFSGATALCAKLGPHTAFWTRDRAQLRGLYLHGAAGNQFCCGSSSGTTDWSRRSGKSTPGGMVGDPARCRIHELHGFAVRHAAEIDRTHLQPGSGRSLRGGPLASGRGCFPVV